MRTRGAISLRFGLAVLLWGLLVFGPQCTRAQDQDLHAQRKTTEKRLQQLKSQIQEERDRLEKTQAAEQASQEKLKSLRREIALREELVSTYQSRLQQLEQERTALRDTLATLQRRLDELRQEYRQRVIHAYKYGRLHDLALLLASRSINQMLIRARYLRRFAAERRERRQTIRRATADIRTSREKLAAKRAETRELLAEARTERQNLRALERDRRALIDELQARRSKIEKELKRKQRQAEQLERRIQKLVARTEREETETSPEEQRERAEISANLSASFRENRGELPWPADGAVTVGFGNRVDPVHQTTTYHPGIRIATNPASSVRAVFDGTVSGIDFVPGYGSYVVLRHGDYLSVYSNFSSLSISEGQRIEAGQAIGQSGTEDEPLGPSLFFAIGIVNSSSSEFVDPITWLSTR